MHWQRCSHASNHGPCLSHSCAVFTLSAELVDIFPTVAELSGLPTTIPGQILDGKSLAPVLHQPEDQALAASLKPWALSQYHLRNIIIMIRTLD